LKLSVETRLESDSFEPLIDFLAVLVQKLWSKINKLNNYLIKGYEEKMNCYEEKMNQVWMNVAL